MLPGISKHLREVYVRPANAVTSSRKEHVSAYKRESCRLQRTRRAFPHPRATLSGPPREPHASRWTGVHCCTGRGITSSIQSRSCASPLTCIQRSCRRSSCAGGYSAAAEKTCICARCLVVCADTWLSIVIIIFAKLRDAYVVTSDWHTSAYKWERALGSARVTVTVTVTVTSGKQRPQSGARLRVQCM